MNRIEEKFMGKVRLIHGCISQDERITSRDIDLPRYYDSVEEARAKLKENSDFYNRMGYKLWFGRIAVWDENKNQYIEQPRTNFMNG